jgi:putative AlgH/UPF0301 family transcriptional regulator
MGAWGKDQKTDGKVMMLADGSGDFTRSIDLELDAEIQHHDWFSTPGDPKLIFDDDRAALWKEALARRTQDL